MSVSVRIPPALMATIARAAKKAGKTKTAFIMEAVNTKLGLIENREQVIRNSAGWLSPAEASDLRRTVEVFEEMLGDASAPYPPSEP